MTIEDIFGAGHRSLFLASISEPRDNDLTIVVLEASAQGPIVDPERLGVEGQEVLPTPGAMAIEVAWSNYILYAVSNETYATRDAAQPLPERMLEQRRDSRFLRYVEESTWARDDYPGPIQHWTLYCENQVIDVACLQPPLVSRIPVAPEWLTRERATVIQRR